MNITWITKTIRHVGRSFKGVRMQGVGVKVFCKKVIGPKGRWGGWTHFYQVKNVHIEICNIYHAYSSLHKICENTGFH